MFLIQQCSSCHYNFNGIYGCTTGDYIIYMDFNIDNFRREEGGRIYFPFFHPFYFSITFLF